VCVCVSVCVCVWVLSCVCVCVWGGGGQGVSVLVICALTVVFPCFFLSCKANARVKTRKDGARPAPFHVICYLGCSVVICVVLCIVCV
jgi:hypothetical protein